MRSAVYVYISGAYWVFHVSLFRVQSLRSFHDKDLVKTKKLNSRFKNRKVITVY